MTAQEITAESIKPGDDAQALDKNSSLSVTAVKPQSRVPELDGLRGIACLTVILWHYVGGNMTSTFGAAVTQNNPVLLNLTPALLVFGTGGVDLFFVLSGFLIGGILIDNRESKKYFQTFFMRRACRILPLYFLVVGIFAACIVTGIANIPAYKAWLFNHLTPVWSYPLFIQNILMSKASNGWGNIISMTWSVALEEQFYLFFPFVVFFLPTKRLPLFCILSIVFSCIARIVVTKLGWWPYPLLICRFDPLAAGILCAVAVRNPIVMEFFKQKRFLLQSTIVLSAMTMVACIYKMPSLYEHHHLLASLMYASTLLLVITHKKSLLAKVCRWPILVWTGIVSYGAYMFHQGIQGFMHAIIRNQVPTVQNWADISVVAASIALTFALASFSYLTMETFFLKLGKKATFF